MNTYIGKLPPWIIILFSLTFAIEMIDASEKQGQLFSSIHNTGSTPTFVNFSTNKVKF